MRAREFVINIPITIKIDGDGDPVINDPAVNAGDYANENPTAVKQNPLPPKDPSELNPDPVMVPPLQQQIEINKAAVGKTSPVIDELTQDEKDPDESNAL